MNLVEIIKGKKTTEKSVAVALDFTRIIKKTPIVVNDARGFFGSGPAADTLAGHTMDTWINFARTGNPRSNGLSNWTPYEPQNRTTAILGDPVEVVNAPFEEERALWDGRGQTALPLGPARGAA